MSAAIEPPEGFRTTGRPPRGARLLLIRHGEAQCNVDGVVGGPRGCGGLTDRGREQAMALRDRLTLSRELADAAALYTSVLPRARETADLIAPALAPGVRPRADCDLCELHPGDADGLTWDELLERFGGPDWDRDPTMAFAPGGESWVGFYERVRRTLEGIADRHAGQLVVLVVHGGVIEQLMKVVLGAPATARLGLRTEHCSMTEVEFDGARRRLLRYNDRAPLIEA